MRTSAIYCPVLAGFLVLTSGGGLLHAEEAGRGASGRVEPVVASPHDETLSASEAYGLALAREIEQAFRRRDQEQESAADLPVPETTPEQGDPSVDGEGSSSFSISNELWPNGFQKNVEDRLAYRSLFDLDRHETGYKSMVFRFGQSQDGSGEQTLPGLGFRSVPVYEADLVFEPTVVAVEYQYELLQDKWGLGSSKSCLFDTLSCQWRAIFHLDGGKVFDEGDGAVLADGTDFLRAGVNLSFNFQPKMSPLDRFETQISTFLFEDLAGDGHLSSPSEKIVFWRVDNEGDLKLRARYYRGELPLNQDKFSVVTLGLEVNF